MPAKELIPTDNKLIREVNKLSDQIGNTPVHHITRLIEKKGINIFAKKEWLQLSGSVKARAAYSIIRAAIFSGELDGYKILLDATSGNTGIAYATIAKALNIPVALCLPENASAQRKEILLALGADIIYTSKFEGTDGAQEVAKQLAKKYPNKYFYADQYKNDNNWKAHYNNTAIEIYKSFPDITHFVAGLGTTGTFTGTGRRLKELKPSVKLISLQPDTPLHGLEGWKHLETAIVPKFYDSSLADENLEIDTRLAYEIIKDAKKYEGLLLSPSSAANIAGAIKVAEQIEEGVIVTVLPDNADKYSEIINRII
ncbi:MAG: cysteine synthase family protein [Bacteroidia bacterium]|nr:cysteine synthase family protein [Bacteroidia bacterium]